jgi:hypothetical protein
MINKKTKTYKPRKNFLLNMPPTEETDDFLRRRFRFDRTSILKICQLVEDDLRPVSRAGGSLTVEIQVNFVENVCFSEIVIVF